MSLAWKVVPPPLPTRFEERFRSSVMPLLSEREWWRQRYGCVFFDPMPKQKHILETDAREIVLSGGQRSGKSDDGACRLARHMWGVEGLFEGNGAADGRPRHYWAVALSAAKQEDTLKPKLQHFLGPLARWQEAKGIFRLPNGSTCTLKSQEAELDKFQSVSLHGVWVDEVGDSHDYYEQMRKRLTDHDGWILTSMTPTKGVNWMFRIFKAWHKETLGEERKDSLGRLFVFLDALANVYLPTKRLRTDLDRSETTDRYDMDRYGKFVEIRGLVFPNFSFERHVLKCLKDGKCSLETPAAWARVRGMDFGHAAPSTCLFIAEDPRERELVVYRELYDRGRSTIPELCEMIRVLSAGEKYQITVLDPSCWQQDPHRDSIGRWHRIADDYEACGVEVYRGNNDTRGGIEKILQLLGKQGTRPRLFIHECCRNTIDEIESLHWKEGVVEGGVAERIAGDDHAVDGLKYAVNWFWEMWESAADGFSPDALESKPYGGDAVEEDARPSLQLRRVENPDGTWRYERVFTRIPTGAEEWGELEEETDEGLTKP